jgi:hypothetical protein
MIRIGIVPIFIKAWVEYLQACARAHCLNAKFVGRIPSPFGMNNTTAVFGCWKCMVHDRWALFRANDWCTHYKPELCIILINIAYIFMINYVLCIGHFHKHHDMCLFSAVGPSQWTQFPQPVEHQLVVSPWISKGEKSPVFGDMKNTRKTAILGIIWRIRLIAIIYIYYYTIFVALFGRLSWSFLIFDVVIICNDSVMMQFLGDWSRLHPCWSPSRIEDRGRWASSWASSDKVFLKAPEVWPNTDTSILIETDR